MKHSNASFEMQLLSKPIILFVFLGCSLGYFLSVLTQLWVKITKHMLVYNLIIELISFQPVLG